MRNAALVFLVMLIIGCAHGSHPIAPGDSPISDLTNPSKVVQDTGKILWGCYNIILNPDSESAEIVPLRGLAFKANVTQFLQPPAGHPGYVSFKNLDFSDFPTLGIVRLEVGITHPFPGFDMYRGFDVLGVFMSDATFSSGVDSGAVIPKPEGSDARLLNADGYTRWFNPDEFPTPNLFGFVPGLYGTPGFLPDSTVNGYKYFADDLDPDVVLADFFAVTGNLDNRGSFTPGSVNKRDYEIKFPDPGSPLQYQYAIIASWEGPANPDYPDLSDFAPEANQAEPFLLLPDHSDSTVYYESDTEKGGVLRVDLTVFDWQTKLGGTSVPAQIQAIHVESFGGFITSPVDILPAAIVTADGPASSTFSLDIASVNPTHSGDEWLLITVESADPDSYNQGFGSPASDGVLSAYVISKVFVSSENPTNQAPSVGDITGETEPLEINAEEYEIAALDPEGDPLYFEWSLMDDGFAADWGNVGEDAAIITIDWNDYGPGDYDLHCRVKDDYNDWQLAMNNPLDISVSELTITCGDGVFGYLGYAWSQCQAVEPAILSDGSVVIEYGYSFTDREFEMMRINYELDIGGYCYYGGNYDLCDDDWCEMYDEVYYPSTDPTNRSIHMDSDFAGTYGENSETDDVVAFVMSMQPNIVRFLNGFNNTTEAMATEVIAKTIATGSIEAIDFDEDGDLWVLDSVGNVYELTKSSTYTVGTELFTIDMDTMAPGTTVIFDWAISYLSGDLFIFTDETVGGTIHKISGSSGSILTTQNNALDAGNGNPAYGLGSTGARGDIEIDHRIFDGENSLAEHCRLIVSGGPGGTGQAAMFARYDQALALLSTWDNNQTGGGSCNNPPSTDGGRFIIFDPVDHVDDPGEPGDEESWDHTMWVGDAGTGAGNLVWASDGRPCPDDWDGW